MALNPTDELRVRCVFDTSDRDTPTAWGEGTSDEMCLATFYTYDDGPIPESPPPAAEDPSCPHYVGEFQGMALDLLGCCTADAVCGVISRLTESCITQSSILTDLAPGPACDPASTDDADAGVDGQ